MNTISIDIPIKLDNIFQKVIGKYFPVLLKKHFRKKASRIRAESFAFLKLKNLETFPWI